MNEALKQRLPDSIDSTKLKTWTRKSRVPIDSSPHLSKEETEEFTKIISQIEWPDLEDDDETPPPVPKKCECGAKFTSNPNYHMDWCPMGKDDE